MKAHKVQPERLEILGWMKHKLLWILGLFTFDNTLHWLPFVTMKKNWPKEGVVVKHDRMQGVTFTSPGRALFHKKGPTHRLATLQYVIRRLVISRRQRVLITGTARGVGWGGLSPPHFLVPQKKGIKKINRVKQGFPFSPVRSKVQITLLPFRLFSWNSRAL